MDHQHLSSSLDNNNNNNNNNSNNNARSIVDTTITPEGAKAFMELLLKRNYFQNNTPICCKDRYVWPHVLQQEINTYIQQQHGKVPLSTLLQHFAISFSIWESFQQQQQQQSSSSSSSSSTTNTPTINWHVLGHHPQEQVWHEDYLQTSLQQVWQTVLSLPSSSSSSSITTTTSLPYLPVTVIAKSMWHLPFSTTLDLIRKYIPNQDIQLRTIMITSQGTHLNSSSSSDEYVLVSSNHLLQWETMILDHFRTITTPTKLSTICEQQNWPLSWVKPLLLQQQQQQEVTTSSTRTLPGIYHHGDDSYIPYHYLQQQQEMILDIYQTVGVVTDRHHSMHQLIEWIGSYHHQPLVLTHAIINPVRICSPLESIVQDNINVLELHDWIPSILSQEDGQLLMDHILFPTTTTTTTKSTKTYPKGMYVWNAKIQYGIYFSNDMIQSFRQRTLPTLVRDYAHEMAQQFHNEYGAQSILESIQGQTPFQQQQQQQQLHKHSKKDRKSIHVNICLPWEKDDDDSNTILMERIIRAIRTQYCDELSMLDTSSHHDDDNNNNHNNDTNVVVWKEICTMAFFNDMNLYQSAFVKELQHIVSSQVTHSTIATTTTTTTTTRTYMEFESMECFPYACYLIQLSYQFIQYAKDTGMKEDDMICLNNEFLYGLCAHFTWRITQYCLFRNAVDQQEDDLFVATTTAAAVDGKEKEEFVAVVPESFSQAVDVAVRQYHPFQVSVRPNDTTTSNPLVLLRHKLPGSVGNALVQQWILCKCCPYSDDTLSTLSNENEEQPPSMESDNDDNHNVVDAFQTHVRENCLLLTGLPYKILDKKSEKKFLTTRRTVLMERIQSETDPGRLLDWTIMLLYQQVKNCVVHGSLLRGPILQLLTQERKITSTIADELITFAELVKTNETIDPERLEHIRSLGLKKK